MELYLGILAYVHIYLLIKYYIHVFLYVITSMRDRRYKRYAYIM